MQVPEGWKIATLNNLVDIVMGFAFKSTDFTQDGIPLLRMGNLYQNTLDFDRSPVFLPESYREEYNKFLVKPGDLVMSMTGTMGKRDYGFTVKIPINAPDSLLNQRVVKLIPKKSAHSEYLLNLLRSELILSRLYSFPGGTKQANLSAKQLQNLPTIIPPLSEQQKIAQILSTWDQAITATEQLLTNSQQQKKALMQQLLTGKKRLLDDKRQRFSKEWSLQRLGELAKIYQPKTISQSVLTETGYPVYGANGIIGLYSEYNHATEQIAVTCRGSTCGVVNLTQPKSWITGNAMVVNVDENNNLNKKFLFYMLCYSDLNYLITGSGQPQITGNIKIHLVSMPGVEEQEKIATVLTAADKEITTLEQKLEHLKQEKKSLMQQLLTGKRKIEI